MEQWLVIPHGQPFLLPMIAELAKRCGDPDWRILCEDEDSYSTGVPVGVEGRMPRTPSVFERKLKWRVLNDTPYDPNQEQL